MIFYLKYGKTLYDVAAKHQSEAAVLQDLENLAALLHDKKFQSLMLNTSFLPAEEFRKVITSTFEGKIDKHVMNLLVILAKEKRLKFLPKINNVYRKEYHAAKGIMDLTVRTAIKLDPQGVSTVIKKLEDQYKKPVSVRFEIDETLIGGIQIYEKGYLTDFSIKNYLKTLHDHLMNSDITK